MRCLITGATGFIGGSILRGLEAAGHEVVAYVRESSDSRSIVDVERVVGDLANPNRIATAARGCDVIIHAAGVSDPAADRETLGWTHVAGTENAINAARHAGCARMIQISCAEVTLHPGHRAFWGEDEAPVRPYGALAASKLQAEDLVRVSGSSDFRTIVLRPALVWGPGATHLASLKSEAAAGGVRLVGGGKRMFATTHIDNLVRAAVLAVDADVPTGSVYYVVDGELSLSREFYSELCDAFGWEKPRNAGPFRWAMMLCRARLLPLHPTDIVKRAHTSAFDTTRASGELGYEPTVTREEGMIALRDWVRQERGAIEVGR